MVSVRNVKSISYLARWLVPLPFALTRKTVVKAARNARYLRVSAQPIRECYLPFVTSASASCSAMGAETRPCNQRERATLREKTFPHFTHSSPRFSSPTSRISLSASAKRRGVLASCRPKKGDRKYLLCSRCGRQWKLLCTTKGFFYDIKL